MSDAADSGSHISVVNEEGQVEKRYVPSTNSIKRIILLPLENKSNNQDIQWLTFALPQILKSDLEQDSRVIGIAPESLNNLYDEYSVQLDRTPPFSIQRKIALDNYTNYFMNGEIEKSGENYLVTTRLINTVDGKEVYTKSYENVDPLNIVDQISEDFRSEVYVENELGDQFIDLPVSNLYTNSLDALEAYTEGIQSLYFKADISEAIVQQTKAITIDPKFAVAHSTLGICHIYNNDGQKAKASFKNAMNLKDMLSERMQFLIKYSNVGYENPVKATGLLEMWSQLYPMDYMPYNFLITIYQRTNELEKAKETALRALENGHSGSLLLTLAYMENQQGNFEASEKYYARYEKEFPHKKKDNLGRGNIFMAQGEFDKAQAHFEKMYILESDNANIIRKLAEIQGKKGNFDKQLELLDEALSYEKQLSDSVYIYRQQEAVYYQQGHKSGR